MPAPAVISSLMLLWTPASPAPAHSHAAPAGGGRAVHLQPMAPAGAVQRLELSLDGERVVLELEPWSVRGRDFRCYEAGPDGTLTAVDPGPVTTLRARALAGGVHGPVAAGGLVPGGILLTITLPDGRTLWLEPASPHDPAAGAGAHLLYTSDDVPPGPWCCGNGADAPGRPGGPATTGPRGQWVYEADLACDADYEYYTRWGGAGAARQRIEAITATVNLQFERDTGITHRIGTVIVRTSENDPYTTHDAATLNAQISAAWAGITAPYDLLILYTGRDVQGPVVGRANGIGSVCNGHHSNCFAQSDYNGMYASACDLTAHELGHLWGACHCACASPAYTMNPSITSVNRFGGPPSFCGAGSVAEIAAYRATRPCLAATPAAPGPPNDGCGAAVTVERGLWGYSTLGATASPEGAGDIPSGCAEFAADVWYRYTPPCPGTVAISVCASDFDTLLAVYTGACDGPELLACSDDSAVCGPGSAGSRVTFAGEFGREYLVRVGSPAGAAEPEGTGLLSITNAGCIAPANNSCSGALTLQPGEPAPFSTVGATAGGPLEPGLCDSQGFQGFGPDVWFRYTAACDGPVRLGTCGSTFDTRLAVYPACPSVPGNALACSDEDGPACAGSAASLEFTAVADATYLVRIGGTHNQQGTGTLLAEPLACPPPANNACAAAALVDVGSAAPFDTLGATTDGPAAACASFQGQVHRDVWFALTAPCAAPLRIAVCDAPFDARLALYTACPTSGGTLAACSDDACGEGGLGPQIIHASAQGAALLVRVGSAGYTSGPGTLTVSIAADWDRDGSVGPADLGAFLASWLACVHGGPARDADFSGDGAVTSADLSAFIAAWIAGVTGGC